MCIYISLFLTAVPGQCPTQDVQTVGIYGHDGTGINI